MMTKKIGGANKALQKLVNDREFNFNRFMKIYTKKCPEVLESGFGRETVMHALNVAAVKSVGGNGTFYAQEMAERIADALPRITKDDVLMCMEQPQFLKEPLLKDEPKDMQEWEEENGNGDREPEL